MKELPSEIVVAITEHLTFSDKLKVACACKNWYDVISQTSLYSSLTLDQGCFHQAMVVFDKKQHIKQHVRNLVLFGLEYDMLVVLAFPTSFSNITSLEWYAGDRQEPPVMMEGQDKSAYAQALQQWKDIDYLRDNCIHDLHIAIHLLENVRFDKLIRLHVSFNDYNKKTLIYSRVLLQDLIKNIHNAPSLEYVSFEKAAIRLTDMEDLHGSLPQLKKLVLDDISLYHDDSVGDINHLIPSNTLQSFILITYPLLNGKEEELTYTISNWIAYIGAKYRNLQELTLNCNEYASRLLDKATGMESLVVAMTNLIQIKSLSMDFCTPSKPLLDVMDSNNVRLDRLKLKVKDDDIKENVFRSLQSSNSSSTVKYLELSFSAIDYRWYPGAYLGLSNLLIHLKDFLTHLTVKDYYGGQVGDILLDILQNLMMLEELELGCLEMPKSNSEEECSMLFKKLNTTVVSSRLKSLHLGFHGSRQIHHCNRLFAFVLKSCPLLEEFKLNGSITALGALTLNFGQHTRLKYIEIDMTDCTYYIFDHHPGVLWGSFERTILEDDIVHKVIRSINLAWIVENDVKVQLAECKIYP